MNKSYCILAFVATFALIGCTVLQDIIKGSDITLEIICEFKEKYYVVFTRKKLGTNEYVDIISVVKNVSACWTHDKSSRIVAECFCNDMAVCYIPGTSEADSGDQWQCRTFNENEKPFLSKAVVNVHRVWRSTFPPTHISDNNTAPYEDSKFKHQTEVTQPTNESTEVYTNDYSIELTTIDRNVNKLNQGESNVDDELNNKAFSKSELVIIIAAAAVTLIIAANISICAYWRYKTHPSDQQTTTVVLSSIDVTSEENTHVHYHEIADTQIEPMTGGSTSQTNMDRTHHQSYTASPIENVDSIILTQTTTTYNISHAPRCHFSQSVTWINDDVTSPSTYSTTTATEAGKPFPFLALAEINMSDEMEGSSDVKTDISCERADVEPENYENLDRSLGEDSLQYSNLA